MLLVAEADIAVQTLGVRCDDAGLVRRSCGRDTNCCCGKQAAEFLVAVRLGVVSSVDQASFQNLLFQGMAVSISTWATFFAFAFGSTSGFRAGCGFFGTNAFSVSFVPASSALPARLSHSMGSAS